jgi:hypothetical protein
MDSPRSARPGNQGPASPPSDRSHPVKRAGRKEMRSAPRHRARPGDEIGNDFEAPPVIVARFRQLDRDRDLPVPLKVEAGVGMPAREMVAYAVAQYLDLLAYRSDGKVEMRGGLSEQRVEPIEQPCTRLDARLQRRPDMARRSVDAIGAFGPDRRRFVGRSAKSDDAFAFFTRKGGCNWKIGWAHALSLVPRRRARNRRPEIPAPKENVR